MPENLGELLNDHEHVHKSLRYFDQAASARLLLKDTVSLFDVAPGIGVGKKWVNRKGWTFEYMIGFGRFLFNNDGAEATFKGGISIGKRF